MFLFLQNFIILHSLLNNFMALTWTFPGIVQWLIYSGIGGGGTITNALSGGDFKQPIYLQKLIFEAIIRTKVEHFNCCSNFLTEEGRTLLEDFQKCVNFENLSNLLQQLKTIQFTQGDMSYWIRTFRSNENVCIYKIILVVVFFFLLFSSFELFVVMKDILGNKI